MNFPHFVRIDREGRPRDEHYVVHAAEPKFTVELSADKSASGELSAGVIKRVCVPNSWAGDYGKYAKLLTKAQEFFAESGRAQRSPRA
ncbi:MAG: hypothetical protein Q8M02_12950 [Candidatus Didemnitutus sp.]|nr:hypothetical protein [Candidatus Didemnitutus sp.]